MNSATRALWLALMIFFSAVIGAVAGLLVWASGEDPFSAVLKGGAAFAATLALLLGIFHFATAGAKV